MKCSTLLLCVAMLLCSKGVSAQRMYVAVEGGANVSYLKVQPGRMFNSYITRKRSLLLPGGEAALTVGLLPLNKKWSPLLEVGGRFLYRRYVNVFNGYWYGETSPEVGIFDVRAKKTSYDIAFVAKVGVKYKAVYFSTGPVIEKFIKGRVSSFATLGKDYRLEENYIIGKPTWDYQGLRYYWLFEVGGAIQCARNVYVTPKVNYIMGISPLNYVHTPLHAYYGKVHSFFVGVDVRYSFSLRKTKKSDG